MVNLDKVKQINQSFSSLTTNSLMLINTLLSIHPLGATALGEHWPPQQPVSIALSFVFSIHCFIATISSLLHYHPVVSQEAGGRNLCRASGTLVDGLFGHLRNKFQVRLFEANYVDMYFFTVADTVADKARLQVFSCVSVFSAVTFTSIYIVIKRAA